MAERWCPTHGSRRHACVHEAGHTVAAGVFGIPILSVQVFAAPSALDGRRDVTADGTVRVDIEGIAAARAAGSISNTDLFHFALAGEAAETALLGHATPHGAAQDVREFWAWTKRQTFTSLDEYEEVLGESLVAARQRVSAWARSAAPSIEAVSQRLDAAGVLSAAELSGLLGTAPNRLRRHLDL